MKMLHVLLAGLLLAPACSPEDGQPAGDRVPGDEEPAAEPERTSEVGSYVASAARGFPALRDLDGQTLANGDFARWAEGDRLHVRIQYGFYDGRVVDEQAAFRHTPGVTQVAWSWRELRDDQVLRQFEVDFEAGIATGEKHEEGEVTRWSEEIDVQPGMTFAGFGFSLALQGLRDRLIAGEAVELDAVAFTPEPRVVTVELSYHGVDAMEMGGRVLRGERFEVEPQIPWIARLFVNAPTTRIWLTHPPPAEFLRFEGPLLEPEDPIVRVDVLPGGGSGPAEAEGGEGS